MPALKMEQLPISSSPSGFCLFCYKSIESSIENTECTYLSKKFVNSLSQFIQTYKANLLLLQDVSLEKLCCVDNLVKCCFNCKRIIENFCENYNQLKLLELDLDWKLCKLIDDINHGDNVPSRWVHISVVLEDKFNNGSEKITEIRNAIKKFRQNFVNAGRQRQKVSQPRVLLERKGKKPKLPDQPVHMVNSIGISGYNMKNFTQVHVTETKFDWKKFREAYKDLKCTECAKQLTSFKGLRLHLQGHKDESEWDFECPQCKKKFTCQMNLKRHMRIHTGERPFECQFCGVEFRYRECFKRHLKAYHEKGEEGDKNNLVGSGKETFKKKFSLKKGHKGNKGSDSEESSENEDKEKSELDDDSDDLVEETTFPNSDRENDDLEQQVDNLSEITGGNGHVDKTNIEALDITAVFKDPLIQVKHEPITVEDNLYVREKYSKMEANGTEDVTDLRTESIEKQSCVEKKIPKTRKIFSCKLCQKRFRRITQLNKHLYIDTCPNYLSENEDVGFIDSKINKTTKELICTKCGKQLKTVLGLNLHLRLHNRKINEYTCNRCGNDFSTRGSLKLHLSKCKVESIAKTFKCLYCKCKYSTRCNLRRHMAKLHWNEKSFEGKVKRKEVVIKEEPIADECVPMDYIDTQIGQVEIELTTKEIDADDEDKTEELGYQGENFKVGVERKNVKRNDTKLLEEGSALGINDIDIEETENDSVQQNMEEDRQTENEMEVENENTFGRKKDSFGNATFIHLEDLD